MTTEYPYQREFYLRLDEECQNILDKCYHIISRINYYENECGFEMMPQVKEFKNIIFNMLKAYEEGLK